MAMLQLVIGLLLIVHLEFASTTPSPNLCETIAAGYGYPCQHYSVTTKDGYILQLQRIPHGRSSRNKTKKRIPVFLQHGFLQGGESWLMNEPSESLGFILADQGFDVWIGNTRGSRASQGHISLSTENFAYWDWSFHEYGTYDVPAMLELIYKTTKSKIHYIGHSQGGAIGLIALTQKQVPKQLSSAILLSPIVHLKSITPKYMTFFAHSLLDKVLLMFKIGEFNPTKRIRYDIIQTACKIRVIDCSPSFTFVFGNNTYLNKTRTPYYLQFLPQSTSIKNIAHLAQLVRHGEFMNFDYGSSTKNMEHYNQSSPPHYELSSFPPKFPILLTSGGIDGWADVEDIKTLNSKLNCKVTPFFRQEYGHADYIIGTSAHKDVYGDIIKFIKDRS